MMLPPSMEECIELATKQKPPMPESEGRKFFFHYESIGWKVGKLPMKSLAGAMGGWHERWKEKHGHNGGPPRLSVADKILKREEYNRVLERIKTIQNSYDSHNEMRMSDREQMIKLRNRANQLRKELGLMV